MQCRLPWSLLTSGTQSVLGTVDNRHGMNEHEPGKDDKVQAGECFGQPLVIACQPPEPIKPAEAPLGDSAARQQDKAFWGLGQFDDLEIDPFCEGRFCGRFARIT